MQLFEHPYSNFLQRVEKPTRYTGAEHGTRRKDWQSVDARVCLAFPDIYDIGMSHLGFRMLYKILNDHPRTLAERAYTPWVDMQRELYAHGKLLLSLESARPLVRLRRGRLFAAIRADLHQHFEDARALGHSAAQCQSQ